MFDYRRRYVPGGSYFFTVVTYRRRNLFDSSLARRSLRDAIQHCRKHQPFEIDAVVLLPDHLHMMITLPDRDSDYSQRWNHIKRQFTLRWRRHNGHTIDVKPGQAAKREPGVWQARFWEHAITDKDDFAEHFDYIHFNPVKHGHVSCPHQWRWSSFQRFVKLGVYDRNWACHQRQREAMKKCLEKLARTMGE